MEDTWSSVTKYLLIIVILSVLGLNIFYYLAKTTDAAVDVTKGVVGTTAEAVGRTLDVSAVGAKTTVDVAAGATKDAINVTGGVLSSSLKGLENALDIKVEHENNGKGAPTSDDSDSGIQEPRKSGYCYIGTEKGFRSCLYVGKRDTCMSGEVYPTMDICINPKLRA